MLSGATLAIMESVLNLRHRADARQEQDRISYRYRFTEK